MKDISTGTLESIRKSLTIFSFTILAFYWIGFSFTDIEQGVKLPILNVQVIDYSRAIWLLIALQIWWILRYIQAGCYEAFIQELIAYTQAKLQSDLSFFYKFTNSEDENRFHEISTAKGEDLEPVGRFISHLRPGRRLFIEYHKYGHDGKGSGGIHHIGLGEMSLYEITFKHSFWTTKPDFITFILPFILGISSFLVLTSYTAWHDMFIAVAMIFSTTLVNYFVE